MKILFISHEYPPIGGGGANACHHLAGEFAAKGHSVHIVTAGFNDTPALQYMCDDRVVIYRVDAARKSADHSDTSEMFDYMRKAYPLLKSLAAKENYDACLCFFGIPSGPLARRLKAKYGLPYIIRFGGGDIPGFQDRFGTLYKVLGPEVRRIWKDSSGLVANSEGLRNLALDFCSDYPIDVICNGVDTDMFSPRDQGCGKPQNNNQVRLLTTSRLIRRKGFQDVIPHIKSIERAAGKSIRWTVAGDGPYREELQRITEESGAADCIAFIGGKTKQELVEIYRQADLFVFPSHKEGMPNVVLEAMASGLPIIMRKDCQGCKELITDNGIAAGDDFIARLTELISMDPDALKEMGERSRQKALSEFTWEHTADQYLELLSRSFITNSMANGTSAS